nr:ferrochelatase [Gammaproteobacteria bacterium]
MTEKNQLNKKGILLINLGTPASPRVGDVRRYLREFLSDPHVIDIPAIARWLLLNTLILPLRPFKTSKAYKKIWSDKGSPLLANSVQLRDTLSKTLGKDFHVTLGMRYGEPNIETALLELKNTGCEEIAIIPLYPQYASSTTHSSLEKTEQILDKIDYHPEIITLQSFFDNKNFIAAYADLIAPHLEANKPDILLFSYHGLPVRHIEKTNCQHIKH